MRTIMILADTTCRRYLNMYGCDKTITPNLDRLASKGVVFENHWCGSAPCMPARRDIFTGRLNFLERNWGGAEPFDHVLPKLLRDEKNVYSRLITDHMFYLSQGGENFHSNFNSYDVIRGQEHDPYVPLVNTPEVPPHHGLLSDQYNANRSVFINEEDFPSPRTFQSALDWMDLNKDADNYFLMVESFDPHEPFDTPQKYLDMYDDHYDGIEYFWPHYDLCDDTKEQNEHIHKRYFATLTMMDTWMGKLLDKLDEYNLWEDTAVIFTTDHGFMLGEHGYMAKNYMPAYNEVFHIPFVVYHPEIPSGRCSALTQNIDIFPTIAEFFGITPDKFKNKIHGKSLVPLMKNEVSKVRDEVIYGYYGSSINVTDGKHTYFRAAKDETNTPLYMYTAMPSTLRQNIGYDTMTKEQIDKIETGTFLDFTNFPVFKIPANLIDYKNESQVFNVRSKYNYENLLFNIKDDYAQNNAIKDEKIEEYYIKLLKKCMKDHEAPKEQYERLGI